MLTPLQIKSNYFSMLDDSRDITGVFPSSYLTSKYDYTTITEKDTFTAEQWSNLVKVASIIKANENRFSMNNWHGHNECGTTHCIAGWAESLAMNDTNYDEKGGAIYVARYMLSEYVDPFFLITLYSLNIENMDEFKGLPEQLVMKWFIDPILEEAHKESYELSSEITQFIQKAKEETQLITA